MTTEKSREEKEREEREAKEKWNTQAIRLSFILVTFVFLLTLLGFAFLIRETHNLAESNRSILIDNRNLINENKRQDRTDVTNAILLCRKNIEGVRQIFRPFYPKPPLTFDQRRNINRFNARVNTLKRGCTKQLSK